MDKVYNKYKEVGVHIAKFVCDGLFTKLHGYLLEKSKTEENMNYEVNNFFKNIESFTIFLQNKDDLEKRAREVTTKINSFSPPIFIILCFGMVEKATKIKDMVISSLSDYTWEKYQSELSNREIFLIIRK